MDFDSDAWSILSLLFHPKTEIDGYLGVDVRALEFGGFEVFIFYLSLIIMLTLVSYLSFLWLLYIYAVQEVSSFYPSGSHAYSVEYFYLIISNTYISSPGG